MATSAISRGQSVKAPGRFRAWFLRSEDARGYALMGPTLVIMFIALAAPLILLLLYSFWTQEGYTVNTALTLDRYLDIFVNETSENRLFWTLFRRSVSISGVVTLVTLVMAYPIAYYVAFHVTKYKFIWLILLTIPFWTSYLLRVFAWKIILGYQGVINSGLQSVGIIDAPLEFLLYNPTSIVITLSHAWAAFAILPIYVSLEKIDRTLLEAAADLGDGAWRRFWRITFPLSMPGVISAAVLIFVPTTGDYVTPELVGGTQGKMLANLIQVQFGKSNDWPLGAALALSSLAFVGLLVVFTVAAFRAAVARVR